MPKSQSNDEGDCKKRQRNALACGRCRQRKIKCEGDLEDGQGCRACRNAHFDNCHYLRVRSRFLPAKDHMTGTQAYQVNSGEVTPLSPPHLSNSSTPQWSFSIPSASDSSFGVASMHNDLRRYSISKTGQASISSDRALYTNPSAGHPKDLHNVPGSQYPPIRPRPTATSTNTSRMGTDQCILPQSTESSVAVTQNSGSNQLHSDPNCAWSAMLPCGDSDVAIYEPEPHSEYVQSLYSHAVQQPSDYESTSISEHGSYFPGLSPLARHLPQPALGRRRVLPAPSHLRTVHSDSYATTHPLSGEGFSNISQAQLERGNGSWGSEHIPPEPVRGAVARGSCESTNIEPSSPDLAHETSAFGYEETSPTVDYSSSSATTTMEQATVRYRATTSSQVDLPTLDPSYGSTNYAVPRAAQGIYSLDDCPDSRLPSTSGQRILQPQPRRPRPHDVFTHR